MMLLRACLLIGLVTYAAAPAFAGDNLPPKQEVTAASLESAVRENARQAGVPERWVDARLAEARELRAGGIDPNPYLAKLSEGLAKRVPMERLEAALDRQREAVAQAHKLAGSLGRRHPETVAAGAQLLASGAAPQDVGELYAASQKAADPDARFLALAFGAAGLRQAGLEWRDAARFQTRLAAHDLSSDDIDDVNQAVSAAVADRLLSAGDLPGLADGELKTAGEARRFVTEIRQRGGRPDMGAEHGRDKADMRKDGEHGKSMQKGKADKGMSDNGAMGHGDKGTRGKAEKR